ncbi:hypothetical protein CISG_03101 [Coccidioides immitis RMSCC 3703]|uniref:Uncharacterized protein n=2 Tax=Coccidioides immitis TaxID=5501 RepID=A0A0J8QML5_COCIT|nr:hypothetical protein CIRG_07967 [Coccidioides immitis RMSCC 2394]KMU72453.1 hypothetical protein CISG_03101 [Coccidioides immitis RMSCC 3703]
MICMKVCMPTASLASNATFSQGALLVIVSRSAGKKRGNFGPTGPSSALLFVLRMESRNSFDLMNAMHGLFLAMRLPSRPRPSVQPRILLHSARLYGDYRFSESRNATRIFMRLKDGKGITV